mmetsp:Transcript_9226/g.16233  ORF Transcript_9226/g.16233 Transcript_9226/m.16233 type:complete len:136 (-) Transcript_9226:506-913(-)|eukprot:CAMPEP_0119106002 /NCGR_PEP_ID=MMETSP1180-20130426/3821_1 /TAXON_ID=3052 ORGANISM="Chlamydomonas cf sp, Strain CCMP681" /NCGR_SAMPLE_ID=MMETSP1180 /ASSEMBLY_ACC=CAM_ASM_000741 /LENGTH=135 /DNA_ID=CAMNT_0007091217 /DNA_START=100 /DNA_END=507 /DNA_ORIENTATION=+
MSSRLAQTAVSTAKGPGSAARSFYLEVCRCLPFIQRLHKLDEIASTRELRAMVKSKFKEFENAKDPRVIDLLVFKGREELECYLMMHKQRHHAVTEYIEPYNERGMRLAQKPAAPQSAFLSAFFDTAYPMLPHKS